MSDYDKMHDFDPIYADEADLVYEPVVKTFTAQALAFAGAKFIKKKAWKTGRVYIDNYDVRDAKHTWCFIHPTDVPARKPMPVFLYMLEGNDWVEVKDEDWQKRLNPPVTPELLEKLGDVTDASDE